MIAFTQSLTPPEVSSTAVMKAGDNVDPTLLEEV
jgi:hypothetical protein